MSATDFDHIVIPGLNGWAEGHSVDVASTEGERALALQAQEAIALASSVTRRRCRPPVDCDGTVYRTDLGWGAPKAYPLGQIVGIAFDRRGELFLIDGKTNYLYRWDERFQSLEEVNGIGGYGWQPGQFRLHAPHGGRYMGRIVFGRSMLYVSDTFNNRVQAFYRPGWQLRYVVGEDAQIGHLEPSTPAIDLLHPTDLAIGRCGGVFVLDLGHRRVVRIDKFGALIQVIGACDAGESVLERPAALAIDSEGRLHVLDARKRAVSKFDQCGKWLEDIKCVLKFESHVGLPTLAIGANHSIYVGEPTDRGSTRICQYDTTGRRINYTDVEGVCTQLTTDDKGALVGLFRDGSRVIRFSSLRSWVRRGTYVTKVLDSMTEHCRWHRIALAASVPEKTSLEIKYYASNSQIDPTTLADDDWRSVLTSPYKGLAINDALFEDAVGQYLVMKLELTGDGEHTPSVSMGRAYFERSSFLRYLPAVYQEDERGREFAERFLSVFESMALDIETQIAQISRYWNVDAVQGEFVDWLGSWLAISRDENWSTERKRAFLREAFKLYKIRGTPRALRRAVEIFTGKKARIIEHFRLKRPLIVGQDIQLGVTTFVGRAPTKRLILEESSRIGEFTLADEADPPEKAFERDAYDFTVIADTSELGDKSQLDALRRLIETEKPAHTRCFLRIRAPGATQLGKQSLLDLETILGCGLEPMCLGIRATLGHLSVLGSRRTVRGTIGIRTRIAVDTILH